MVVENFETFPEDVQSQIKTIVSKYTNPDNVKVLEDEPYESYTHHNTSQNYNSIGGNSVHNNNLPFKQTEYDLAKTKTATEMQSEYRNIDDLINNIYAKIERVKYH